MHQARLSVDRRDAHEVVSDSAADLRLCKRLAGTSVCPLRVLLRGPSTGSLAAVKLSVSTKDWLPGSALLLPQRRAPVGAIAK